MKRYWLFTWDDYYPSGGMNDYRSSFHTVEEAKTYLLDLSNTFDRYQIVDSQTLNEMEKGTHYSLHYKYDPS